MTAKPRLLCVDDEPELLDSLRLVLRKSYDVSVAESGPHALTLLDSARSDGADPPFAVVVSDMRMPLMSGAEFLARVLERFPEMPRILLSGQSDLNAAISAINDAKVFRFLTKPCPPELLIETIEEALEQARLRRVERELLDQTLSGTVTMLTEVLGLVSAGAYSRAIRVDKIVNGLCHALGRGIDWDLGLAAKLSQVGCVVVPDVDAGAGGIDSRHAVVASELLAQIPRLEPVAHMIRHQLDEGPSVTAKRRSEYTDAELNAEILRVAIRFDQLTAAGATRQAARKAIASMASPPPSFLLEALRELKPGTDSMVELRTTVNQLAAGMQLTSDVTACNGPKLASTGMILTPVLISRIRTFASSHGVVEPITALAPVSTIPRVGR
ncbi:MAG: response regulator [Acidimicrobiales bacterium]